MGNAAVRPHAAERAGGGAGADSGHGGCGRACRRAVEPMARVLAALGGAARPVGRGQRGRRPAGADAGMRASRARRQRCQPDGAGRRAGAGRPDARGRRSTPRRQGGRLRRLGAQRVVGGRTPPVHGGGNPVQRPAGPQGDRRQSAVVTGNLGGHPGGRGRRAPAGRGSPLRPLARIRTAGAAGVDRPRRGPCRHQPGPARRRGRAGPAGRCRCQRADVAAGGRGAAGRDRADAGAGR